MHLIVSSLITVTSNVLVMFCLFNFRSGLRRTVRSWTAIWLIAKLLSCHGGKARNAASGEASTLRIASE